MIFGISYAEVLLLTATGLYIVGEHICDGLIATFHERQSAFSDLSWLPSAGAKDLPRVARQAGRYTGRAVSYISALRRQTLSYADETEIGKASQEVSADALMSCFFVRSYHQFSLSKLLCHSYIRRSRPACSSFRRFVMR